jgi:hypothetical protein
MSDRLNPGPNLPEPTFDESLHDVLGRADLPGSIGEDIYRREVHAWFSDRPKSMHSPLGMSREFGNHITLDRAFHTIQSPSAEAEKTRAEVFYRAE